MGCLSLLFAIALLVSLLLAPPASAQKTHLFLETFGSAAQPAFFDSTNLALDPSSGDLLVLDARSPKGVFDEGTISRFHADGTPSNFSALGTNTIDAKPGPGGKPCAEEPASCDDAPQPGFTFNSSGSQGLAVDDSGTLTDGNVYITEFEHFGQGLTDWADYLTAFAADGHYLGQLTMAGSDPLEEVCGVTVDPAGNLYVAEFRPGVIGPKGEILEESETRIHKFDPSANPPLASDLVATFSFSPELVCSLAAGAGPTAGSLFARASTGTEDTKVLKLNAASGAVEGVIPSAAAFGLSRVVSVDPFDGHVFTEAREYDASGASPVLLSQFNAELGTASNSATERLYAAPGFTGGKALPVKVLGPIVTVPEAATGAYEITGDTSVRIKGTVNPDGQALTECTFEYGLTTPEGNEPYEHSAPCEAPDATEVGSGTKPVEVHADLSGLAGETAYHYRLVAKNANAALYPKDPSAVARGADQVLKTPSKPAIEGTWAQNVIVNEATLKATLNPGNATTTYRFEWGLDTSYGNSTAEIGIGAGAADQTVGHNLSGLQPATTYHYRVVATNGIGVSEGADHTFTTFPTPAPPGGECDNEAFRTGPGALLPDCRAYELVSPVDKDGGDIRVLENSLQQLAVLEQASDSGEKLAYGSVRSFGDAASAPYTSQYIAQRVAGKEWQTHSINPPVGRIIPTIQTISAFEKEFGAFSPDLCQAWYQNFFDPPLAEGGLPGETNLYLRTDRLCGEEGYEALAPIVVPDGLLASVLLQFVSADGSHAVVRMFRQSDIGARLFMATPAGPQPLCVMPDVQPSSSSCVPGSTGEKYAPTTVSADGSRVFWSADIRLYLRQNPEAPESARQFGAATGKGDLIGPAAGTGNLIAGSELVKNVKHTSGTFVIGQEISSANGGIPAKTTIVNKVETSSGVFTLTLSAKVSEGKTKLGDVLTGAASEKVFGLTTASGAFAAGQEITAPAIPPGTTVLSCSPSCGPGASVLILSAKATKTEAGAALSATSPCTEAETKACTIAVSKTAEEESGAKSAEFWGAAQDGSKAIFTVATGGGPDNNNLYSFEPDGETTDLIAGGVYGVMGISEDARRIYLVSSEVLDAGASAGKPNLYLYEAGEGGGAFEYVATVVADDLGGLGFVAQGYRAITARVSPDGLHAAFASVAPLTGYDNKGAQSGVATRQLYRYDAGANELVCVSCNPSGARPTGRSSMPPFQTRMHGARNLAEDGSRLYFQSADALTLRDSNGAVDVYQWEEPGAGTCTESSPTYSAQNGGCVDLISTGQSQLDSRFVEASPTGEDVFIATGSGLLPQDPGGVDIYDARVGGGLPIPQGPPPGCEGEACQGQVEAPNDPTPASLSFDGAGNVREEARTPARRPCAKGKVRRRGRCVAKHHKRAKQRAKHKRRAGR
jgi:hypothetical protein